MNSSEPRAATSLGAKLLTIAYWLLVVIAGLAIFIVFEERNPRGFQLFSLSFPAMIVGLAAIFVGLPMLLWRYPAWGWRIKSLVSLCHVLLGLTLFALWWWPTRGTLIGAIHRGDAKAVRTSLMCGVDPNSREYWGWHHSPGSYVLSTAALYGNLDIVRLLVEYGAVYNFDKNSAPPLIPAAGGGHRDVVEYFIGNGVPVNIVDPERGTTAFSSAALGGHFDLADRLLELGADPHLGDPSFAGASGRIERLEYLRELGVNLQSCLLPAALGGKVECVRYLLDLGYDPDFKVSTQYTVLDRFESSLDQKERHREWAKSRNREDDYFLGYPPDEQEDPDSLKVDREIHELLVQHSKARSGSQK